MAEERKYVDGMPLKAIQGLVRSPKTPKWIKDAWIKKLKERGLLKEIE